MRTRLAALWIAWTAMLGALVALGLWRAQRAGVILLHTDVPLHATGSHSVPLVILLGELLIAAALLFALYVPPIVVTVRWLRRARSRPSTG